MGDKGTPHPQKGLVELAWCPHPREPGLHGKMEEDLPGPPPWRCLSFLP